LIRDSAHLGVQDYGFYGSSSRVISVEMM